MTSAVKQAGLYLTGVPQWLEAFHLIAEEDALRIAELEAERDNAWTELREIRSAISANPEESTLDEVVKLRQQLAAANTLINKYRDETTSLRQQLSAAQSEIESAFREGFRSPATYNDVLVNDEDDEWENYKRRK